MTLDNMISNNTPSNNIVSNNMALESIATQIQSKHIPEISKILGIKPSQVLAVDALIEQGSTIPFIARYRKETTGSLDEVQVMAIRDSLDKARELEQRREKILLTLNEQEKLSSDLKRQILTAQTMAALEDLYLPFKKKRKTKAETAKLKGLTSLAEIILKQHGKDPHTEAIPYINAKKGVNSTEEALAGARDIIAETVNETLSARSSLRHLFKIKGELKCKKVKGKEDEGEKYKNFFDHNERATSAPSHRILAIFRGEKQGFLKVSITPSDEDALAILKQLFIKGNGKDSEQVQEAIKDAWKRLLSKSLETEFRSSMKKTAEIHAIEIFAENLKKLLLAPPLGPKKVMGIDPGFRTGCKIACLDRQGNLLCYDTFFPHDNAKKQETGAKIITKLCLDHKIEAIAVGNGTAGRETQSFLKKLSLNKIPILLVNESGASIYSASQTARDEFPDLDITIRGAISIGRRLMDPLSELVKIDPKAIGVGQYQHDVDQNALKEKLGDVVESCVNNVGVDLNLAGKELLSYVSGLKLKLAENIVHYRDENGPFTNRIQLKKVPRLGPKAYEQSAGFLRIKDGKNILDASAVHPESYHIVQNMAKDLGCSPMDLIKNNTLRNTIDISKYFSKNVGEPTLRDILNELAKPGRDPRSNFKQVAFVDGIEKPEDLVPDMQLVGIVTNVTAFGAFVDIGVHRDGLVHISEMADRYIKDPSKIVSAGQEVKVIVKDVNKSGTRISLSMKGVNQ